MVCAARLGNLQREMMKDSNTWLLNFKRDVHSQTGEDGIIQKILEVLPQNDKWCVEFGAWDGQHLSNTRNLIENDGYSAVLIEGDRAKFADLQKACSQNTNIIALNRFVGWGGEDSLDLILSGTPVPKDFDFLSIDIDGNDYHVWRAMSVYSPKTICIEFNPTIPTEIEFVQPADPGVAQGASLLSLTKLGNTKGYELVSVLDFNAFFVKSEYYSFFEIENNSPEALRTDRHYITYLFQGYDGKMFLHGCKKLVWHGIDLQECMVQHLPGFLRKCPEAYSSSQRLLFAVYKRLFLGTHKLIGTIRRMMQRLMKP
jgi:hypothetical protein